MGTRYILDTNISIYFLEGNLPQKALDIVSPIVDDESNISIISEIEMLGWLFPNPKKQLEYEAFVRHSNVLDLDKSIVLETIQIRRSRKIKLPDAVIAATAIVKKLTLVSVNDKDFRTIRGLSYLNPLD
jgi:predicted nucleic acid-binding protein